MESTQNVNENWGVDLLQSLAEHDVMMLRDQLRQFRKTWDEHGGNYEMSRNEDVPG
jgi:hypothetical protein